MPAPSPSPAATEVVVAAIAPSVEVSTASTVETSPESQPAANGNLLSWLIAGLGLGLITAALIVYFLRS
jgi:hypothetical protein